MLQQAGDIVTGAGKGRPLMLSALAYCYCICAVMQHRGLLMLSCCLTSVLEAAGGWVADVLIWPCCFFPAVDRQRHVVCAATSTAAGPKVMLTNGLVDYYEILGVRCNAVDGASQQVLSSRPPAHYIAQPYMPVASAATKCQLQVWKVVVGKASDTATFEDLSAVQQHLVIHITAR